MSIRTNQAAAALLILISAFLSVRHPPQTLSLVVRLLPSISARMIGYVMKGALLSPLHICLPKLAVAGTTWSSVDLSTETARSLHYLVLRGSVYRNHQ